MLRRMISQNESESRIIAEGNRLQQALARFPLRSKRVLLATVVVVLVGFTIFEMVRPNRPGLTPLFSTQEKKLVVFVRTAQKQPLFDKLVYPARISPKVNAAVLAEAEGVVTEIKAPLGTRVKAKTPLLTIRNLDPAFRYAPQSVLSPVDGVVGQVDVSVGSRVLRGDKLLIVTDPERVRVTIEVPGNDLKRIKAGLEGTLRLPEQDASVRVRVKGVSPLVDVATSTAHSELQIEGNTEDVTLAPGIVGRVTFEANRREAFLVSDSAVEYINRVPNLRILDDGKVVKRPVQLGRRRGSQVEVQRGLNSGDVVIERANGHLAEGELVEAEDLSPAPVTSGAEG